MQSKARTAGVAGLFLTILASAGNPALEAPSATGHPARIRFEVRAAPGLLDGPASGRLLVAVGRTPSPEPREGIGTTGRDAAPLLGRDVTALGPGDRVVLDRNSALFPLAQLGDLPPGDYWIQAVLRTNRDLLLTGAPGNLLSAPVAAHLDPERSSTVRLTLDRRLPEESLPPDTEWLRFVKWRSEALSTFWGRPMYLRAGIVLPRGWADEPERRYPLLITIGGFGTRFTSVQEAMREGHPFREAWLADDAPRFIRLQLDGAGPLGDPYQVDSDNHGPCGQALVKELIPEIESRFRGLGTPESRVLTGGSTGGWVSLALQVLYPEFFGGCWSGYPDPPDFRALQLVDIYRHTNAFVNEWGFERPCAREVNGDTRFTMRHETQLENVLGDGDSFVRSGGQWGSWNAAYSPRGRDGLPLPIWDPRTGRLDPAVADAWARHDLRRHLETRWAQSGPALRGKIRIWMGDADTYFLDGAVRLFDGFLKGVHPPADARIEFSPGQPHGWEPRTWKQLLAEMAAVTGSPR
ncbi:MAG: esterase [Verrucomicrobia bacterium]|nr:esterase [Verrucomicrobiota bacterium]